MKNLKNCANALSNRKQCALMIFASICFLYGTISTQVFADNTRPIKLEESDNPTNSFDYIVLKNGAKISELPEYQRLQNQYEFGKNFGKLEELSYQTYLHEQIKQAQRARNQPFSDFTLSLPNKHSSQKYSTNIEFQVNDSRHSPPKKYNISYDPFSKRIRNGGFHQNKELESILKAWNPAKGRDPSEESFLKEIKDLLNHKIQISKDGNVSIFNGYAQQVFQGDSSTINLRSQENNSQNFTDVKAYEIAGKDKGAREKWYYPNVPPTWYSPNSWRSLSAMSHRHLHEGVFPESNTSKLLFDPTRDNLDDQFGLTRYARQFDFNNKLWRNHLVSDYFVPGKEPTEEKAKSYFQDTVIGETWLKAVSLAEIEKFIISETGEGFHDEALLKPNFAGNVLYKLLLNKPFPKNKEYSEIKNELFASLKRFYKGETDPAQRLLPPNLWDEVNHYKSQEEKDQTRAKMEDYLSILVARAIREKLRVAYDLESMVERENALEAAQKKHQNDKNKIFPSTTHNSRQTTPFVEGLADHSDPLKKENLYLDHGDVYEDIEKRGKSALLPQIFNSTASSYAQLNNEDIEDAINCFSDFFNTHLDISNQGYDRSLGAAFSKKVAEGHNRCQEFITKRYPNADKSSLDEISQELQRIFTHVLGEIISGELQRNKKYAVMGEAPEDRDKLFLSYYEHISNRWYKKAESLEHNDASTSDPHDQFLEFGLIYNRDEFKKHGTYLKEKYGAKLVPAKDGNGKEIEEILMLNLQDIDLDGENGLIYDEKAMIAIGVYDSDLHEKLSTLKAIKERQKNSHELAETSLHEVDSEMHQNMLKFQAYAGKNKKLRHQYAQKYESDSKIMEFYDDETAFLKHIASFFDPDASHAKNNALSPDQDGQEKTKVNDSPKLRLLEDIAYEHIDAFKEYYRDEIDNYGNVLDHTETVLNQGFWNGAAEIGAEIIKFGTRDNYNMEEAINIVKELTLKMENMFSEFDALYQHNPKFIEEKHPTLLKVIRESSKEFGPMIEAIKGGADIEEAFKEDSLRTAFFEKYKEMLNEMSKLKRLNNETRPHSIKNYAKQYFKDFKQLEDDISSSHADMAENYISVLEKFEKIDTELNDTQWAEKFPEVSPRVLTSLRHFASALNNTKKNYESISREAFLENFDLSDEIGQQMAELSNSMSLYDQHHSRMAATQMPSASLHEGQYLYIKENGEIVVDYPDEFYKKLDKYVQKNENRFEALNEYGKEHAGKLNTFFTRMGFAGQRLFKLGGALGEYNEKFTTGLATEDFRDAYRIYRKNMVEQNKHIQKDLAFLRKKEKSFMLQRDPTLQKYDQKFSTSIEHLDNIHDKHEDKFMQNIQFWDDVIPMIVTLPLGYGATGAMLAGTRYLGMGVKAARMAKSGRQFRMLYGADKMFLTMKGSKSVAKAQRMADRMKHLRLKNLDNIRKKVVPTTHMSLGVMFGINATRGAVGAHYEASSNPDMTFEDSLGKHMVQALIDTTRPEGVLMASGMMVGLGSSGELLGGLTGKMLKNYVAKRPRLQSTMNKVVYGVDKMKGKSNPTKINNRLENLKANGHLSATSQQRITNSIGQEYFKRGAVNTGIGLTVSAVMGSKTYPAQIENISMLNQSVAEAKMQLDADPENQDLIKQYNEAKGKHSAAVAQIWTDVVLDVAMNIAFTFVATEFASQKQTVTSHRQFERDAMFHVNRSLFATKNPQRLRSGKLPYKDYLDLKRHIEGLERELKQAVGDNAEINWPFRIKYDDATQEVTMIPKENFSENAQRHWARPEFDNFGFNSGPKLFTVRKKELPPVEETTDPRTGETYQE